MTQHFEGKRKHNECSKREPDKEQLEDGDRFYDSLDDNVIGAPDHCNKQQGDVRRPVGIPYALGEPSPLMETIFKCTLGFQVVLHNPGHPFVENSDFFSIKSAILFLPPKNLGSVK